MDTAVTEPLLKIGEVASLSGLSVKTIRYYEELGLLAPTVGRSESGYRLFQDQVLNRLAFIKRAQALGLALHEIKDILGVHDQGKLPCSTVKQHLQDKVSTISQQIAELELLRNQLQTLLAAWEEQPSPYLIAHTICPNLQSERSS